MGFEFTPRSETPEDKIKRLNAEKNKEDRELILLDGFLYDSRVARGAIIPSDANEQSPFDERGDTPPQNELDLQEKMKKVIERRNEIEAELSEISK